MLGTQSQNLKFDPDAAYAQNVTHPCRAISHRSPYLETLSLPRWNNSRIRAPQEPGTRQICKGVHRRCHQNHWLAPSPGHCTRRTPIPSGSRWTEISDLRHLDNRELEMWGWLMALLLSTESEWLIRGFVRSFPARERMGGFRAAWGWGGSIWDRGLGLGSFPLCASKHTCRVT